MENLSRVFLKQNKTKKHMKWLTFKTQFKIEFLLLFTGFRKVLRKMPAEFNWVLHKFFHELRLLQTLITVFKVSTINSPAVNFMQKFCLVRDHPFMTSTNYPPLSTKMNNRSIVLKTIEFTNKTNVKDPPPFPFGHHKLQFLM